MTNQRSSEAETCLSRGVQKTTRQINDSHLPKEDVITWSYANGLGLVHAEDVQFVNYIPSWVQTLAYAEIDGKEYGMAPVSDSLVDVFPLEIGKQWFYDSSSTPYSIKVVSDTVIANGEHYCWVRHRWMEVWTRYVC
jgi:hypothetical protein